MNKIIQNSIFLLFVPFLTTPAAEAALSPALNGLKGEAGTALPTMEESQNITKSNRIKSSFNTFGASDSLYHYDSATIEDYNFIAKEPDANGNIVDKYYKLTLNQNKFTNSPRIGWVSFEWERDNTVEIKLPNNVIQYYKYTFTPQEGRALYTELQLTPFSGDVDADFNGSFQYSTDPRNGGAINNTGTVKNISGDFIENASTSYSSARGGAIYNNSTINDISGNFIKNRVTSRDSNPNSVSLGGAIANDGTIKTINGDFVGNCATAHYSDNASPISGGSAIANYGKIDEINGNFIGNYITSNFYIFGGAILNNHSSTIGNISGDFISNYITNTGTLSLSASGAAIINREKATINNISGNFVGNHASSDNNAYGGAIYNENKIGSITGSFVTNYVTSVKEALGGAIFTMKDLYLSSGSETYFISGNYTNDTIRGKNYNAIFVRNNSNSSQPNLTFDTTGGGIWVIRDNIESGQYLDNVLTYNGYQYNLVLKGDGVTDDTGLTAQNVRFTNDIINAKDVSVDGTTLRFNAFQHEDTTANNWDGHGRFVAPKSDKTVDPDASSITTLSLNNAAFDVHNLYQETVKLAGYSANNSFLHLDVDIDNMTADILNVNGDVQGVTKLVLYPTTNEDIRKKDSILFAQSTNDTTGNAGSFEVFRVYRSPYLFDVNHNQTGTNQNEWSLSMNDTENPDFEVIVDPIPDPDPDPAPTPTPTTHSVAPEVIAYQGLLAAGIEQTRNLAHNVFGQIDTAKICSNCGIVDKAYDGSPLRKVWATPLYTASSIKKPVKIDADIWGLEAGFDLQADRFNRLGVFASYRRGDYDLSGQGKRYYSPIGSKIEIDSYLGGLYYRYDRNRSYVTALAFGGIQKADLKSNDGVKSDSDGTQFGAAIEAGHSFALNSSLSLTPTLGLNYTRIDFDDIHDTVGKDAHYGAVDYGEVEVSAKLEQVLYPDLGIAKVYIKPGVVQTFSNNDEIKVSGLNDIDGTSGQTLGRIEGGFSYNFDNNISAYASARYTYGNSYNAAETLLGISYSW